MTTYILENVNGLYDDGVVSIGRTGSRTITNPRGTSETTSRSRLLGTELAEEIEFLTARARSVGIVRANAALAPLALKVRSYSVLSLACSGKDPSQRELADFLSLDPSQIVALVDELEQRGLVTRETDPHDRRSKGIAATAEGRRLYAAAKKIVRAAEDQSLNGLTLSEREQLRSLLQRVAFEGTD
jgi:DNA-binding MarR family transcriptional regulator